VLLLKPDEQSCTQHVIGTILSPSKHALVQIAWLYPHPVRDRYTNADESAPLVHPVTSAPDRRVQIQEPLGEGDRLHRPFARNRHLQPNELAQSPSGVLSALDHTLFEPRAADNQRSSAPSPNSGELDLLPEPVFIDCLAISRIGANVGVTGDCVSVACDPRADRRPCYKLAASPDIIGRTGLRFKPQE